MKDKISAQAQAVLAVLAEKRCHLTAEEILASLENIGTATVYRALDLLTDRGLIRRLALGKKSAVYEYVRQNHMHFVCSRCGVVYDIQADLSGMIKEAAKCCNHCSQWCEVTAHGICNICAEAQDEAEVAQ